MKNLLIIDDQQQYLDSLAVALKKKFNIYTASSLTSAIQTLSEEIDIVLIDIRLDEKDDKNIDGLKVLEWIKKNRPAISSFVMSAYKEFSYAEQALNLGAKHFFKKPIDIMNLTMILQEKG